MCKNCRIEVQHLKQEIAGLRAELIGLKAELTGTKAELARLKQWRDSHTRQDDLSPIEQGRYIEPAAYRLGGDGR